MTHDAQVLRSTGLLLALLATGCTGSEAPTDPSYVPTALSDLSAITHGSCAAVAARFDAAVAAGLDGPGLCTAFHDYEETFGRYEDAGAAVSVTRGTTTVVLVPLHLARRDGEFRVSYAPDRTIRGIFFLREGVPVPG